MIRKYLSDNEYSIQQGDTLTSISKKYNISLDNLIKDNNISDPNKIQIGQKLKIKLNPENNIDIKNNLQNSEYVVKSGDNLSKIAKIHGTSLNEIIKNNNILDPNKINIGDKLKIRNNIIENKPAQKSDLMLDIFKNPQQSFVPKKVNYNKLEEKKDYYINQPIPLKPILDYKSKYLSNDRMTTEEIEEFEKFLNSEELSDIERINLYKEKENKGDYYTVDDKKNGTTSVYKNGKLIKKYKAVFGENKDSDDMTVTYTDEKGKIKSGKGNMSTPAGRFLVTPSGNYGGAPAFMRQTQDMVNKGYKDGIPSSMHLRNVIVDNHNITNGCTGLDKNCLNDLSKYITGQQESYILPVNKDNKFTIRNGELQFKSGDVSKLPSYHTMPNKDFEYKINTSEMDDLQKSTSNKFMEGLKKNKNTLQKDLGINHDTYVKLSKMAFGILGNESTFGKKNNGIVNFIKAATKLTGLHDTSPDVYSKYDFYGLKGDNRSVGLTQIRYNYLSNDAKKLLKKYNINKDDLVHNPEKAAIATLIKLSEEYKNSNGNIDKTIKNYNNGIHYKKNLNKHSKYLTTYENY